LIKHVDIEIANYYHGIISKNFGRWIINTNKNNVEGLYIVIIWIAFLVFALNKDNVVTKKKERSKMSFTQLFPKYNFSYLVPKNVKVSCDDKVVKLSYVIILPFQPFTLIVECVLVLMFKGVLLHVNVLKCVSSNHWNTIRELFWDCNMKTHHFYVKAMI
jgi:hypothetical protein